MLQGIADTYVIGIFKKKPKENATAGADAVLPPVNFEMKYDFSETKVYVKYDLYGNT